MLLANFNYTKNKSFKDSFGKNIGNVKDKIGNKRFEIKEKL